MVLKGSYVSNPKVNGNKLARVEIQEILFFVVHQTIIYFPSLHKKTGAKAAWQCTSKDQAPRLTVCTNSNVAVRAIRRLKTS